MPSDAFNSPSEAITVSDLNTLVKQLLEEGIGRVWIAGEVSNLVTPASGHLYFSLKDAQAQVRCALFRHAKLRVKAPFKSGDQILACGKVSLYPNRGDYQLIIEQVEPLGDGLLRQAFEALKKKLSTEGLFDASHKQPLPEFPQTIGIITSATGAAVRDIISVFRRRFPGIELILYPTLVQGEDAPQTIVQAIQCANEREECDALILARGGGSLEDLWAFNDEQVARAIFASRLPMVVGVGHETDTSIADFVADIRAPTPTAAAELLSPDQEALLQRLQLSATKLSRLISSQLAWWLQHLEHLSKRLRHPRDQLQDRIQKCDELSLLLELLITQRLQNALNQWRAAQLKLEGSNPSTLVQTQQQTLNHLSEKLFQMTKQSMQDKHQSFSHLCGLLNTLSPLQTLERGYAIAQTKDGHILQRAEDASVGDELSVRLAQGQLMTKVTDVYN